MDLIYEGITTRPSVPYDRWPGSEWTWFTKGLRRQRNCRKSLLLQSEWTWFTKGLRRCDLPCIRSNSCQNGPDLRRDYDGHYHTPGSIRLRWMSEWTWFTKGLRRQGLTQPCQFLTVRMDLIYEGITTYLIWPDVIFWILSEWTWFTKGLRLDAQLP